MAKNNKRNIKTDQLNLDEIYRQLRTNIEFSQMDEELNVINIVSTQPNEGKSSVALNLAKVFADKYRKVLLVDCDLRNPSLHRMIMTSNAFGLTNLLTHYQPGEVIDDLVEIQHPELDGSNRISFLSTGAKVPNPTEIVSSNRFANFVHSAKEQYDAVIIDCPPYGVVSDAVPISNAADGTLFVLSAKDTDKYDAREAVQDLERNGANLIGTVMTKVPGFMSRHYYGCHYYGYGYGYGDQND